MNKRERFTVMTTGGKSGGGGSEKRAKSSSRVKDTNISKMISDYEGGLP